MNTQKNVNQRLAKLYTQDTKQELSSEKVELRLADDIKNNKKTLESIFDRIEKEGDKLGIVLADAIRQRRNVEDLVQRALSFTKVAEKSIQDFQQAAKDLGVDSDTGDIRALQDTINEAGDYVKLINGLGKIPQL